MSFRTAQGRSPSASRRTPSSGSPACPATRPHELDIPRGRCAAPTATFAPPPPDASDESFVSAAETRSAPVSLSATQLTPDGAALPRVPLARRVAAELLGAGVLVAVVIGSGIQATELSRDVGLQLLANSIATVFGLGVLIALLGSVSGAHFNPVVTLAEAWSTRHGGPGVTFQEAAAYIPAQIAGAVGGALLADAMFAQPLVQWSTHDRAAGHLLLG